jgi:hypothetical protein
MSLKKSGSVIIMSAKLYGNAMAVNLQSAGFQRAGHQLSMCAIF